MKKATKSIALVTALVLILGVLLAGCGQKQSSTKQNSSANSDKEYSELVKKLPTLKYLTDDTTQAKTAAQVFQQMWKQNLGINVQIDSVPFKTRLDKMNKMDFQIVLAGWGPDYNEPMTFMDLWTSWSANNTSGWKSDEYDAIIKDAQGTNDVAKRMEDYKKAEKILIDQMVIGPVYYRHVSYTTQKGVEGVVRRFVGGDPDFYWTTTPNGVINANLGTEPPQMDPQLTSDATSMSIINSVFEGLMRYDQKSQVMPGIAESAPTVSSDGLTYTFKLRDAKWSNGDPVTANDFAFAWKRALDPKTAAVYAYVLYPIKNAEAYNTKKITDPSQLGIKAIDSKTLQVTLERPDPIFPALTAMAAYMPLNEKFYNTVTTKYGADPDKMIYDGPFKVTGWKHSQNMTLEKNPTYWNKDAIKLNKINFVMVADQNTSLNMFKTKQLDIIAVPGQNIDELKKDGYVIKNYSDGSSWYFQFNCKDDLLKNANIRKALTLAVNRKVYINNILKDPSNVPATGYVSDAMWGQNDTFRKEAGVLIKDNDVAGAKAALLKGMKELGLDKK